MTPPTGYTEDAMVERPAISLLADLGWETVNAYHEFDHGASSLGRETRAEAILTARLRKALQRLNPDAPIDAISQVIEELARDRSRMSMTAANRATGNSTTCSKMAFGFPTPMAMAMGRQWKRSG